jgi:hypothetical protein
VMSEMGQKADRKLGPTVKLLTSLPATTQRAGRSLKSFAAAGPPSGSWDAPGPPRVVCVTFEATQPQHLSARSACG